jgi:hypothetical protein
MGEKKYQDRECLECSFGNHKNQCTFDDMCPIKKISKEFKNNRRKK